MSEKHETKTGVKWHVTAHSHTRYSPSSECMVKNADGSPLAFHSREQRDKYIEAVNGPQPSPFIWYTKSERD
jgi:hypothetical protein